MEGTKNPRMREANLSKIHGSSEPEMYILEISSYLLFASPDGEDHKYPSPRPRWNERLTPQKAMTAVEMRSEREGAGGF